MFHVELDIASKTPKQEEDETEYYPHDEAGEKIRRHRSKTLDDDPSGKTVPEHPTPSTTRRPLDYSTRQQWTSQNIGGRPDDFRQSCEHQFIATPRSDQRYPI